MKKFISTTLIIACTLAAVLSGCTDSRQTGNPESESSGSDSEVVSAESAAEDDKTQASQLTGTEVTRNEMEEENMDRKMIVNVNGNSFTATLEDNKAVDTLVEMMREDPVTIQMSDYAGFEKVGDLGTDLPTSNRQTTTQAGDIVLYQGNQIVIFYGSNSWSYTRLGRIDDLTGWKTALGDGDVTVIFSLEK